MYLKICLFPYLHIMIGYTKIFIFFILLFPSLIFSQTRDQLEKQRNDLIKSIEKTSENIEKNASNKSATMKDLKAIESQIHNRKKLIKNINQQLSSADAQITNNTKAIDSLERKIETMKGQYAQVLRVNYIKSLSESKWSYIFSAESLNSAFLRWRYSKQFEQYVDQRSKEIADLSVRIEENSTSIKEEKKYINLLLADEKESYSQLEKDQKKKDAILKKLKKDEFKLKAKLAKQQKDREKLNQAIESIILAELAKSKEKKTTTTTTSRNISKRHIRWPVQGYVSSKFGNQPHPTIKSLTINNNGIDITTSGKRDVVAVADGKVIGVTSIPGYDYMVIIQHGKYYSVYSKLISVEVEKDENITAGKRIGLLSNENNADLHFELWENKRKLNPEEWLQKL